MKKFSIKNAKDDKKIFTFTISEEIKGSLRETLIRSPQYNLKRKSAWVNEAILMLEGNADYKELVKNEEDTGDDFVFDKIYMTFEQRRKFSEIKNAVIREHPDIHGPQGAIIRFAILNRLTRKA